MSQQTWFTLSHFLGTASSFMVLCQTIARIQEEEVTLGTIYVSLTIWTCVLASSLVALLNSADDPCVLLDSVLYLIFSFLLTMLVLQMAKVKCYIPALAILILLGTVTILGSFKQLGEISISFSTKHHFCQERLTKDNKDEEKILR